jgi:hypothetical protein
LGGSNSAGEWLDFHDHPGTTTIRRIVTGTMPVAGMSPDVVDGDMDFVGLLCPFDDTRLKWAGKHVGEKCQNIKAHAHPREGYRAPSSLYCEVTHISES